MKKNKLYTVNKWNTPLFNQDINLFGTGGPTVNTTNLTNSGFSGFANHSIGSTANPNIPKQVTSVGKKINSSLQQGMTSAGLNLVGQVDTGDPRGLFDTLDPVYHLAGGRESAFGNGLSDTGVALTKTGNPWLMLAGAGLKIVGGLTNAAFGVKTNKEKLDSVNKDIEYGNNFKSNFSSFDDIVAPTAFTNPTGIYEGGWFSGSKARRKNEEIQRLANNARMFAENSVQNNIGNIINDQINDSLANYAALGGTLESPHSGALSIMQDDKRIEAINNRSNAIAKAGIFGQMPAFNTMSNNRFDNGGALKAEFLDSFASNPLGAVMRYNQGIEALAAQREAAEAQTAREAEYTAMQKRLADLETENAGIQSIMAAMPQASVPEIQETPSVSTPSEAAQTMGDTNSNWKYIEKQLRDSGKFNDIQIEGIKYNLQRESGIGKYDGGDNGTARGLAQWRGDRIPSDMSLEGQTQYLIDTLSNYDGKMHWIGRGNYDGFMGARTPEEAHYYIARGYERPANSILDKVKRDSDMSLERLNAFGGELGTNGTDFTNGLLYVDAGGTHESNPLDGVPMGVDQNGIPNLVEEGETVYNNYVFSNRMQVPKFMSKELGLGGSMKKPLTFAEASKKLAEESKMRPNDPISQDGLEASLAKLAEIQETERARQNMEEYVGLGQQFAYGGSKGNMFAGPGGMPQNLFVRKRKDGTTESVWDNMRLPSFLDYIYTNKNGKLTSTTGLNDAATLYAVSQLPSKNGESNNTIREETNNSSAKKNSSSNYPYGQATGTSQNILDKIAFNPPAIVRKDAVQPTPAITDEVRQRVARYGYTPEIFESDRNNINAATQAITGRQENVDPYQTWMRYAPVVGAGIMSLTDALGLTNKPDYTYADKLEAAANAAGYVPNIQPDPIGDYLAYNPLDRLFYSNQLQANARATDRAILNSSSPSRDASLLASGYNTTNSLGNLYRQQEESNRAQKERVAEFNRKTNMFNSQMGLEAAMANARYRQQGAQMQLSGLAQAAALRDGIDARIGAAKAANITNFLNGLGDIGRENFALNQLNSDRSRRYTTDKRGIMGYKQSAAYGGKIKKRNK